jgi:hypothetical protein
MMPGNGSGCIIKMMNPSRLAQLISRATVKHLKFCGVLSQVASASPYLVSLGVPREPKKEVTVGSPKLLATTWLMKCTVTAPLL